MTLITYYCHECETYLGSDDSQHVVGRREIDDHSRYCAECAEQWGEEAFDV